jgi:hypothetical protein
MKLETLKSKLFEKELSVATMSKITGGYTLTKCQGSATPISGESDCEDKDADEPVKPIVSIV